LSLALETMLPRILSSVCVATYLQENPQDISCNVSAIGSKTRHPVVSPKELSRKWRVGVNKARQTLKATTQRGIRTAAHPLTRRCRADHFSLRCGRLNAQFYSDTVFATTKSLKGDKSAQVFTAKDFIRVHPMKTPASKNALRRYKCLLKTLEFPPISALMVRLNSQDLIPIGKSFVLNFRSGPGSGPERVSPTRKVRTKQRPRFKKRWKHKMVTKGVHGRLWDF
jgi:hypothetical protein